MICRSLLLVFILACALPPAAAQVNYNLPHLANGTFGESRITTTFVLFNNSNSVAGVTLRLRDDPGNPLIVTIPGSGTASVFNVVLQPGQTLFLQTDGNGPVTGGAATVDSTVAIGFSAIFTIQDSSGEFVTESGVGTSPGFDDVMIAVDGTGSFSTGVGLQNLTGETNRIFFRMRTEDGEAVASEPTIDLPPFGHIGIFATGPGSLFPELENFRGRLRIFSLQQFGAVTLRQNTDPLSFTTLPVARTNVGRRSFVLPQIANGGDILTTTFVAFNLSSRDANLTISTRRDSGQPWELTYTEGRGTTSELALQVPSRGAVFVQTDGSGPVLSGAARVESDRGLGVSAIYTLTQNGVFQTETGVGDAPGLLLGTFPADTTGTFDTGIAILNLEDASIDVEATLIQAGQGPAGGPLTKTLQIPPNGHTAQLVGTDLFPGQEGLVGSVSLSSVSEFSAVSIRQNADPLAFTTLPVANGAFVDLEGGSSALAAVEVVPDMSSDTMLDIQLPGGFELSGTVTESSNSPAPAQTIPDLFVLSAAAIRSDGVRFKGTTSPFDPDGYSVAVPPGLYRVEVCYVPISDPSPAGTQETTAVLSVVSDFVSVSQDTQHDVGVVPQTMASFSGTIGGLDNVPDLTSLTMILQDQLSNTTAVTEVGEDGSYSGMVPQVSRLDVHLVMAREDGGAENGQVSILRNASEFSTGLGPHDFDLPGLANLSGQVTRASQPAPAGVLPDDQMAAILEETLATLCLPTSGVSTDNLFGIEYDDLLLSAGPLYSLSAFLPDPDTGGDHVHPWKNVRFLARDAVVNIEVPALPRSVTLSGTVTGPGGEPLEGASVDASSVDVEGAPGSLFTNTTQSGPGGSYSMKLRSGKNYRVEATPPTAQGGSPF